MGKIKIDMNEYFAYMLDFIENAIQYIQMHELGYISNRLGSDESSIINDGMNRLEKASAKKRIDDAKNRYDMNEEVRLGGYLQNLYGKMDKIVPQGRSFEEIRDIIAPPTYNKISAGGSSYYIRYLAIKSVQETNNKAIRILNNMKKETRKRCRNVPCKKDTIVELRNSVILGKK